MRDRRLLVTLGLWLGGMPGCEGKFQSAAADGHAGAPNDSGPGGAADQAGSSATEAGQAGAPLGEMGGDSSTVGGGGGAPAVGTGEGGEGGAATGTVEPSSCRSLADCATGENCVGSRCVAALVSCAAQKNSYPSSKDGVYWIGTVGAWQRAYCDMQLSAELCSEVAGEHHGRTRGKAVLDYTMSSVLLLNQQVCKLWALRGTDDGHPFDELVAVDGVAAGQTCVSLGFAADGVLGACEYGSEHTNCGFTATPLYWYGNNCAGCVKNDGSHDRWTLMGPAITAFTLSSMSGTSFTTCKVEK